MLFVLTIQAAHSLSCLMSHNNNVSLSLSVYPSPKPPSALTSGQYVCPRACYIKPMQMQLPTQNQHQTYRLIAFVAISVIMHCVVRSTSLAAMVFVLPHTPRSVCQLFHRLRCIILSGGCCFSFFLFFFTSAVLSQWCICQNQLASQPLFCGHCS